MEQKDFFERWIKRWLTWDKFLFLLLAVLAVIVLEVSDIGCPILYLTGISCPGCGLTRAYLCLLRGNISGAFYYHPLWWGIPTGVLLGIVSQSSGRFQKVARLGIVLLLFLWILVYIDRMMDTGNPIVLFSPEHGTLAKLFQ